MAMSLSISHLVVLTNVGLVVGSTPGPVGLRVGSTASVGTNEGYIVGDLR
jgi:hypothetical protein